MQLIVNGRERTLAGIEPPCPLEEVLTALQLQTDRIAVELNGEIAPRSRWPQYKVSDGDKLEIVHFVGGGRS